jgi:hypothetical protein
MYGTELVKVCLNTEFLKKIAWGGIWSDESHLTKNAYGSTNQELMRLMATIPVKRQLSGTYISDNPIERPARSPRDEQPVAAEEEAPAAPASPVVSNDADDDVAAVDDSKEEKKESDALARTRAELADLDDLDI